MEERLNAAKLVASAILGKEMRLVEIAGKTYIIEPPTIHKLAGCAYYLSELAENDDIKITQILYNEDKLNYIAKAMSYLVYDSEKQWKEFTNGTITELANGIQEAYGLIGVQDFSKLLALSRNVSQLTAVQKL